MKVQDLRIPATDGFELAATLYRQGEGGRAERFVLITSATGVKRRYYHKYACFLCEQGFAVLTFDYRGIGDSRPKSLFRFKASMREWAEKDIAGVIEWVVREYGIEKMLLIGHSAGGQLVGLAPNNNRVAAMLAIAAQSGYWRFWAFPQKYLMACLWYLLVPVVTTALTYFPSKRLGLAEDLPGGVAIEWARWCRHPHYIVDRKGQPVRRYFEAFEAPILYYSFEDDGYAPKEAVEYLANCYVNAPKQGQHLRPGDLGVGSIGHFGFFQEKFKPLLWQETADWLKRQREAASRTDQASGSPDEHDIK